MLFKSKTYDPGISSYPADVLDPADEVIGSADDADEYAAIWNSNLSNSKQGRLYAKSNFIFTLVSSGIGCCSCRVSPIRVPGCGGGGGSSTPGAEPHLDNLTSVVGGPNLWDPAANTNSITLPIIWVGKRLMVFRNGLYFEDYVRTTTGIELSTPGDVFQEEGIKPEEITFVNY